MQDYEKLGAFYLGKTLTAPDAAEGSELLLYDSRDLTTHGVIVGMTGSGKTGLAVALLEEAAIDGIPAIVVDPKGDLGNLLLTFPDLAPADFTAWVDDGDAQRKGLTREALGAATAEAWRKGLAEWGQGPERIARLRASAEAAIYTPGSSAGTGLSVLRSFAAPPRAEAVDPDATRERIASAVSGLLALMGIEADPIRSREHILLAKLVEASWSEGRDLDLAALIRGIQKPPFAQVGVLDLESFFPGKERAELAMALNNLLASPGFAAWMEGEPLDIGRLLWTAEGKPRLSVLSIAHLSDAERMFFVTLLLNETVAWMRRQPGTTSLRALLYMDEIFGYFPPTANPPSKIPMLTLLKQARAFGLGVVLSTQNPVDLDYKGLANAGTWFLGRLQTERDQARVLEGLEGASAASGKAFDRARAGEILAGLGQRVFLMHDVHEDAPVLFRTRWTMAYLRGPLTRAQIAALRSATPRPADPPRAPAPAARPVVPADLAETYLAWRGTPIGGETLVYRPSVLGVGKLHFVDAKAGVDAWADAVVLAPLDAESGVPRWEEARGLEALPDLEPAPRDGAAFDALPPAASQAKQRAGWKKGLGDHLYRTRTMPVLRSTSLGLVARAGESEGEFRSRLQLAARERRDADLAKLRAKWAPKVAQLQEQERRAAERVEREKAQYDQQKLQTAVSFGATLLGAFMGRKAMSAANLGRATTAARGLGRASREARDVGTAEQQLEAARARRAELDAAFEAEVAALESAGVEAAVERFEVKPRKSDVAVDEPRLAWAPHWVGPAGSRPAWS